MMRNYSCLALALLFIATLSCSTESTTVYTLTTTVNPAEGGTITPNAGSFDEGEIISLQATPADGWVFARWEQDLNTTANPMNITMTQDYNIVGVFERRMHPITVTTDGQGTVTETIVSSKTTEYAEGSVIALEANPAQNWAFSHWDGDLSGTQNPAEITVDKPKSIIAVFYTIPTVSTNQAESITDDSAQSGGNIIDDGGASVTARGVCWSTSQNPTTANSCTSDGSGNGSFSSDIIYLNLDTRYFVRAYAINAVGTAYGNQREFRTRDGRDYTIIVNVKSRTGRTWMDRNLGASRVATEMMDFQSFGDLYQWGRRDDGHQRRNSLTTRTLANSDQPGHGNFITVWGSWRSPRNDNLWQGVNGINNPCPSGYRLPTQAEWQAERQSWSNDDVVGAIDSPLKLPIAGYRDGSSGSTGILRSSGNYWSSTVSGIYSIALSFSGSNTSMYHAHRAEGYSVRCIKD